MALEQEFQAAAERINNLPPAAAAEHMTELYGLFKQATDGDVNMGTDEVDPDGADKANGPAGLSQAQWESWNQFKGLPEEEAKRRYVQRAAEITGGSSETSTGGPAGSVSTDNLTGAPTGTSGQTDNTTTSRQAGTGPGVSEGGLRGDITAGAPYGGEDMLKGAQQG